MARLRSIAAYAVTSLWLGAGFVSADREPLTNVDDFVALADEHGGFPHQTFRSTDIVAPVFQINSIDRDRLDDQRYIFIGSVYGHMKAGPMIIDTRDFSLVYADQKYENAYTSEAQIIDGERYLTFWEGYHTRGHANGYCLIFDEQYNLKYNVTAQGLNGALADMHEMTITNDKTVIFSTYFNIPWNCSSLGGEEDGLLMDSGFQEVDLETNEVLFEWAASKHFSPEDSHARYTKGFGVGPDSGYDFAHINSVTKTEAGNYLVSSRHLSLLTLIDGTDGHPIWILGGGESNQFEDLSEGNATNFGWQHHARFYQNESQITMFDNHGEHTGSCEGDCLSRGLHLEIDEGKMTVRVVQEYYHPESVDAGAMGGLDSLPNGNAMVAWGHTPAFVEYTSDGTPVMDVQRGKIGGGTQNDMFAYRVHKSDWTGRPKWSPSIATDSLNGTANGATVYLSWNGATDIAKWYIFSTNDMRSINEFDNIIKVADRTGFETKVELGQQGGTRYIAAAAVDENNGVLGSTVVYDLRNGKPALLYSLIDSVEEEPEPEPEPEPETEVETETQTEPDISVETPVETPPSESDDSDSSDSVSMGSFGAIGAGVVALAGIGSLSVWLCRRRSKRTDVEQSEYKPVRTED